MREGRLVRIDWASEEHAVRVCDADGRIVEGWPGATVTTSAVAAPCVNGGPNSALLVSRPREPSTHRLSGLTRWVGIRCRGARLPSCASGASVATAWR